MVLTLYIDFLSQPSRFLYIFCRANNVEFKVRELRIMKGEHRKVLKELGGLGCL